MQTRSLCLWAILVCVMAGSLATYGASVGTAITYQGQLKTQGAPYAGSADLIFTLYDAATSGSVKGGPITLTNVTVVTGLFAVQIDFGAAAFAGDARWIDIQVRTPTGSGSYTTLAPRQPIAVTPYAQFAGGPWVTSGGNISYTNGNVGIGTPTPGAKLEILAADQSGAWIEGPASGIGAGLVMKTTGSGTRTWEVLATGSTSSQGANKLNVRDITANADRLTIDSAGNVGIGTNTPAFLLHVVAGTSAAIRGQNTGSGAGVLGSAGSGGTGVEGSGSGANGAGVSGTGLTGAPGVVGTASGQDGIQGSSDNHSGVYGTSTSGVGVFGTSSGAIGAGVKGTGLGGGAPGVVGTASGQDGIQGSSDNHSGVYGTSTSGVGVYGIGATGGYFHSNGQGSNIALYADGLAQVKTLQILGGADLAEPFDVGGNDVQPGMVIIIDPKHPGQLKVASRPYDRCVAGVISGAGGLQPGLSMGQPGSIADGKHQVALTGRVYCRCDAKYGAIEPGDQLTTSATPGHAMKVTDRASAQGAIIGKAMSKLDKGRGLVLVLVSLQ